MCSNPLLYVHPLLKQNAVGLSLRKWTKLLMTMLHGLEALCKGALHDDVFTCLKVGLTAWTTRGGIREESLAVFTNRSVACGHAGEMYT